jgi:ribonucleoside-diphosphate reductase alpha chain
MGWGSSLYMMKVAFASEKAEEIKDRLMKCLTETAIETSINLAKEKGMFKDCEPEKHANAYFWKQISLREDLIDDIRKYGIRNSALFSIQPTGNTSILANVVSGGLEPIFMPEYIRTVIVPICPEELKSLAPKYWEGEFKETELFKLSKEGEDDILIGNYNNITYKIDKNRGLTKEVSCMDYGVRFLKDKGEWNPKEDWAKTAISLTVEEHVKDMSGWGKWIDSSMSKTVNCPNDYPYDKFENLYLYAYKTGYLKGITTYRAGTMTTVLSVKEDKNESCEKIVKTKAPKRGKELAGEINHITIAGHRYYVAIGLLNNDIYEIFAASNHDADGEIVIPKNIKYGKIVKECKGKYLFISDCGKCFDLTNGHTNETVDSLTRIISCSLRHGADISVVVSQLSKTKGPMISFAKVLSRTLKKYIVDGTEDHGEECPSCGNKKLIFQEGCVQCPSCGFSKCS